MKRGRAEEEEEEEEGQTADNQRHGIGRKIGGKEELDKRRMEQ